MKWLKKWSFVIILVIMGIIYYGADKGMLKISGWESVDPLGEGKPEEDWQQLQGIDIAELESESVPAQEESEEDGAPQSEEPDPVATPEPESLPEETEVEEILPEPEPEPEIQIGRVEDDYFSDALFLGDSRTVGLHQYGGLGETATFYASTGMTIYKLFGAEIVELPGQQEKISVEEALQHQSFGKIYIMVGINEMGYGTVEKFAQAYGEVVAHLQELQPDAIIYIQAILKVTTVRSDKGDYINNEGIEARNEALSQLADGERIFYLDVNEAVCDEDGGMVKDYTSDGVHLKAKYISLWEEYLKDNAVLLD